MEQTETNYSVSSHALKVIAEIDGSLKFCDRTGKIIRAELPPQCKSEGWIHQAQLQTEERISRISHKSEKNA